MKRWSLVILALLVALSGAARASEAPTVEARGAVLIDGDSGRILFGQNENERFAMASTTKIMTAHARAGELRARTRQVTAGPNAAGVEGTSSIYLSPRAEHAVHGAHALRPDAAQRQRRRRRHRRARRRQRRTAFAELMNARAEELGADAHFVNPARPARRGPRRQRARRWRSIMRRAMAIPEFRTITATQRKVIPWARNEYSRVLREQEPPAEPPTRARTAARRATPAPPGRCLVFSAERGGLALIGVVLGCPDVVRHGRRPSSTTASPTSAPATALEPRAQPAGVGARCRRRRRRTSVAVVAGAPSPRRAAALGAPYTAALRATRILTAPAPIRKGETVRRARRGSASGGDGRRRPARCSPPRTCPRGASAKPCAAVLRNWLFRLGEYAS